MQHNAKKKATEYEATLDYLIPAMEEFTDLVDKTINASIAYCARAFGMTTIHLDFQYGKSTGVTVEQDSKMYINVCIGNNEYNNKTIVGQPKGFVTDGATTYLRWLKEEMQKRYAERGFNVEYVIDARSGGYKENQYIISWGGFEFKTAAKEISCIYQLDAFKSGVPLEDILA